MGKVKDDIVSMVNIYFAIKCLSKRAEATADRILRCFQDNNSVNPRDLWRKIRKRLNLGLVAKIFTYVDGQYRISDEPHEPHDIEAYDDADADADANAAADVSASNSAHSSRASSVDAHPDGSTTKSATSVTTPTATATCRRSQRLIGYLNAHGNSSRNAREVQQLLIVKGLQQHYATREQRQVLEGQKRRKVIRKKRGRPPPKNRPRRSSGIRRTLPNPRRRRRGVLSAATTTSTRRCNDAVPCIGRERSEKAVIDHVTREMTNLPPPPQIPIAAVDHRNIFNEHLKIDFSPKRKNSGEDNRRPSSSNVSSTSSKSSGVSTEEKRTEEDSLVYTSKMKNPPIVAAKLQGSSGNNRNREPLRSHPHPTTTKNISEKTYQHDSWKSPQKRSGQPTGKQIVESMGVADLVTFVDSPTTKGRKKDNREEACRSGCSKAKQVPARTNLLNIPPTFPHRREWSDSDDEDYVPLKRCKR